MDLESNLPEGMLKGAAATAVLRAELKRLSGDYDRLSTTSVQSSRASQSVAKDLDRVSASSKRADQSINQLTGRLRLFADAAAIFGPTAGPLGGVLIAGVAGFASQLGFAAIAGGVLVGSMQGLGDALSAMNDADLEPTSENLAKAEDALNRLAPAARKFAEEAHALAPMLRAIRDAGAESLFPGLTDSLDDLERLAPVVAGIFSSIGGELGDIASESAASLASDRWADFFTFIQAEGPKTLSELAATVGDLTHGLAELWQAFTPLNNDFSGWLRDVASGFDGWASGLSQTQGFREFIDYIRETGPQVADTLGALGSAVVQIVQATAPLGGPVLAGIEGFADAVGAIADSDLGTPIFAGVAALALLNRTLAITSALSKVSLSGGIFSGIGTASGGIKKGAGSIRSDIAAISSSLVVFGHDADKAGQAAERMKGRLAAGAGLAGIAVLATGAADGIGLTNTASLALMGTMAGPWGAAIGGGIGLLLDWRAAGAQAEEQQRAFALSLEDMSLEQLNAGLAEAAGLMAALGGEDTLGGGLVADQVEIIQTQIDKTNTLAAAEGALEEQARGNAEAFARSIGMNIDVGNTAEVSAKQIEDQAKAFQKSQQAARESAQGIADSYFSVSAAVNAADGSLDAFLASLEAQANAFVKLEQNAKLAGENGVRKGLINQLEALGPAGAAILEKLANGTETQIERANRAFKRGEDAKRDYVNTKVPPTKIVVENGEALTAIERIRNALLQIKDKSVTVRVTQTGAAVTPGFGPVGSADGSTVPHAPGPYRDQFLYALAQREEVVSNRRGQADRFRPALKAINADMPRHVIRAMLADGGTAGSSTKKKPPKLSLEFESANVHGPTRSDIQAALHAAEMQAGAAADQDWAARIAQRAAEDQLEASEQTAQAAENNLKAAQQQYDTFRESVASQFNGSLTGGGLAGLSQTLDRDTNASESMNATLRALVAAGLDVTGPAAALYRELAASEDQRTANELLAAGPEAIAAIEQKVADREAANAARADETAQATYGPIVAAQQAAYSVAQAQLAQAQAAESATAARHWQTSAQLDNLTDRVGNLAGELSDAFNSTVRGARR